MRRDTGTPLPSRQRKGAPLNSTRKTALVAGVFYLITFISIPTLVLYDHALNKSDYIVSAGSNTSVLWGGLLEVVVALAGIGTAVTLFPVVKRQNESMALGFVATRTLEAGLIYMGVVTLHSLVTLRHSGATGADATALLTTGKSLVATYNWTFLLGQSLTPALNALLLGTLMYKSGLVPRIIPTMGLIGAPLLIVATVATLFGGIERTSTPAALAALPVAAWELSLGLYLVIKGFRPSPITDGMDAPANTLA